MAGKRNVVFFDLDGTLTDPAEGITNCVAYALREMGRAIPERKALYRRSPHVRFITSRGRSRSSRRVPDAMTSTGCFL